MPRIFPPAPAIGALLIAAGSTMPAPAQEFELVWSDEFDGTALDTDSWEHQIGTGASEGLDGWGNNELQYYTNFTSNVSVSNGTLKITAREESFGGRNYTSGRIRTKGMRDFQYGRFEGRIKLPSTDGIWPAFWMLPTGTPYGTWAASGEMDIMESVNTADSIFGTAHYGAESPGNVGNGNGISTGEDFSADFHIYAMEWEPDEIRWYLDGQLYHTISSGTWFSTNASGNDRAPFDVPFHLLLNVAVGGNFPGDPGPDAVFPQTLEVDYVRVYQSLQEAFPFGPATIPGRVKAENFDAGYNGQSYSDADAGNNGGEYRSTDVDIESTAGGGFNVGWIEQDEWLEYSVDVQTGGTYELAARVASESTGGAFRIERDGTDLTGPIGVPVTGGWQSWTTVTGTLDLAAGEQIIRFTNLGGPDEGFNIDDFVFSLVEQCTGDLDGDGSVSFADLNIFVDAFQNNDPIGDLDDDGDVTFSDLNLFTAAFSVGCP